MSEEIAQRIANDLGLPDLVAVLSDRLSGSDAYSILLAATKRRIANIDSSDLIASNPVSKGCDLDGRALNELERIAYETAAAFDVIDLSPVNPLGAVSVLTGLDQGNVLSTLRGFECASDPTIGLALECARKRSKPEARKSVNRTCTSQRVLRFPVPTNAGFTAHFKLFSLVSAGRDAGSFSFELEALREHIEIYLTLLRSLCDINYVFKDIVVELSDTRLVAQLCEYHSIDNEDVRRSVRARDHESGAKLLKRYGDVWSKHIDNPLEDLAQYDLPKHLVMQLQLVQKQVLEPLASEFNDVKFHFNLHRLTGLNYYAGPCFHIKMKNDADLPFMLADGGFTDWTQRLLSDKKERLLTSAIGMELICRLFRRTV